LVCPNPKDVDTMVSAICTLAEMKPQNLTEAMLAGQMIAVNDAVHLFLRLATLANQGTESDDILQGGANSTNQQLTAVRTS